jgi:hypothetical protein
LILERSKRSKLQATEYYGGESENGTQVTENAGYRDGCWLVVKKPVGESFAVFLVGQA